jgi:hypothetical protein
MRQSQPNLDGNIDKDEYRISTGKVGSDVYKKMFIKALALAWGK